MANDLNKFMCIGRLGKDPEIKYMANGNALASFSVASSEKWKDKTSGEMQERTEWVNCTAFGKLAEIIGEYVKKGSRLYIEGKMRTDKYTDQNGVEKYSTKIIVDNMQMLDSKSDNNASNTTQNSGNQQHSAQNNTQQQRQPQQRPSPQQNVQTGLPAGDEWDDSEIPF